MERPDGPPMRSDAIEHNDADMLHLTADLQANHERFIHRVRENRTIWGLKSNDGWAVCASNEFENRTVFPFWSDEAYAKRHCQKEWMRYVPTAIDLDSFVASWLKGIDQEGALVGTNWNAALADLEIEPLELAKQLLSDSHSDLQLGHQPEL